MTIPKGFSTSLSFVDPCGTQLIIIQRWEDFQPWIEQWQVFLQTLPDSSNPFYEPDWLRAAWDYPGAPMRLALVFSNERIAVAMAFCPRWNTGNNVLVPVRSIHCMPHLPMLYSSSSLLLATPDVSLPEIEWCIEQTLKQITWDVGLIGFLNEQTQWFESVLNRVIQQRAWHFREVPCSDEAVINLSRGVEDYWASRSGNMRQKIRKGERILRQSGNIDLIDMASEGRTWDQCWKAIQSIYNNSWQKDAGLSPFDRPWRDVNVRHIQSFYEKNRIRLYLLFFNGKPIAYDLWLSGGNALYGLARGMDMDFQHGSAGDVLAKWGISHAYQQKFLYQFMGPINDQPHFDYKKRWTNRIIPYRKILFFRPWSGYGLLDRTVNHIPPIHWAWKRLHLTALSHSFFHSMQSLRDRFKNRLQKSAT